MIPGRTDPSASGHQGPAPRRRPAVRRPSTTRPWYARVLDPTSWSSTIFCVPPSGYMRCRLCVIHEKHSGQLLSYLWGQEGKFLLGRPDSLAARRFTTGPNGADGDLRPNLRSEIRRWRVFRSSDPNNENGPGFFDLRGRKAQVVDGKGASSSAARIEGKGFLVFRRRKSTMGWFFLGNGLSSKIGGFTIFGFEKRRNRRACYPVSSFPDPNSVLPPTSVLRARRTISPAHYCLSECILSRKSPPVPWCTMWCDTPACHTKACQTVPTHDVPFHTMPCHAMFCHAMPCREMPSHAVPCHAMSSCHAMPCHAMPSHAMSSCHVMSCHVMPSLAVPCHAMPCHAMPCHAMPCHATSCHAMPCHAMPCHVM